ncbi:MAG TPA: efflux RND transporter periplasmic adaptor subunit [Terriglobales bacterium]|nr:efflux RND transporter periplasmic adaptor subunit [Terriglobales bacterium]
MNIGRSQYLHRALLLIAMCISGFCLLFSAGCSKSKTEEPTVTVQIAPVEKQTVQRIVTAEAILFPLQQSALVPKVSAPVRTFYVKRGSRVRKGQLLAVLENRDLAAAAQENQGAYDQAQAAYETTTAASLPEEIQKAKLDVQVAKETLDATQKLYDSRQELYKQGALPRKDLDQAAVSLVQTRSQYDIATKHLNSLMAVGKQQELKSAAGQLESAKGKYLGAQAQLSYSEIRSPIDGVVTDRPLYPGEMAAAGTPLITLMDVSQVIARAHIPQDQAALLKVGDNAKITVAEQDKPVEGKVTVVSPALDPNSTTVEVWVQAKNPEQRMKPGVSVQLFMLSQTVPGALVVPASAILTAPDGGTSVMVVGPDNRAHQKAVRTGIKQGDDIQILEGAQEGEKVITSGAYGLPDNTKVTIEAAKESSTRPEAPAARTSENDEK